MVFALVVLSIGGYWYLIKCKHTHNTTLIIVLMIVLLSMFPLITTLIAAGYFVIRLSMRKEGADMCARLL